MIANKKRIIFRADGNSRMGLGHVVRSCALAENFGDTFEKIFVTRCNIPGIIKEAEKYFNRIVVIGEEETVEREIVMVCSGLANDDIVVLDGYHFKECYQEFIRQTGASIVCIDDIHNSRFFSDIIINSVGGISPMDYEALPLTQFYLGPEYTLLRKTFLERAATRRTSVTNKKVFLCLGGADPDNKTLETLQFIDSLRMFEEVRIVVGGGYQYNEELNGYIRFAGMEVVVRSSLNADEMVEEMMDCSYAVCSPSTVCFEYMTLGGVLFLQQIAGNQDDMIRFLITEKLAFHLNRAGVVSEEEEKYSLQKQAAIFDGKAGDRLKKIFENIFTAQKITVRSANENDLLLCYEWVNDPQVREQSYSKKKIPLPDHERWFSSKLEDDNSFYYILELENCPFAQIRFQVSGNEAILGYLVDKQYRNRGLGTIILSKGIETFTGEYKKTIIITGYVKESNIASQKSFEKLKFTKETAKEYPTSYKYKMFYAGN